MVGDVSKRPTVSSDKCGFGIEAISASELCSVCSPSPQRSMKAQRSSPMSSLRGGTELTNYQIEDKKLFVRVALHIDQPWRLMMGKRPGIYFEDLGLFIRQPKFWLALRVWLIFHPPGRAPIPDVRVWCQKLFVPGGQFESNRRHH